MVPFVLDVDFRTNNAQELSNDRPFLAFPGVARLGRDQLRGLPPLQAHAEQHRGLQHRALGRIRQRGSRSDVTDDLQVRRAGPQGLRPLHHPLQGFLPSGHPQAGFFWGDTTNFGILQELGVPKVGFVGGQNP